MGWLVMPNTKENMVKELVHYAKRSTDYNYIKHTLVGNHLWMVVEKKSDGKKLIVLDLIKSFGDGQYGYKPLDEMSHPYYYDCPIGFLKMATDHVCEEWREKVIQFHKNKQKKSKLLKSIKVNDIINLKQCSIPNVTISKIINNKIYGVYNNNEYRIPKKYIAV